MLNFCPEEKRAFPAHHARIDGIDRALPFWERAAFLLASGLIPSFARDRPAWGFLQCILSMCNLDNYCLIGLFENCGDGNLQNKI